MNTEPLYLPSGVVCNGRSELIAGRGLLHFTDHENGGDFTMKESEATPARIDWEVREHRRRWREAAQTFAPVAALMLLVCATFGNNPVPFARTQQPPPKREIVSAGPMVPIDGGRRYEQIIRYRDGRSVRFIYEAPKFR